MMPTLVTLYGDASRAELTLDTLRGRMDPDEIDSLLSGEYTYGDLKTWVRKYPELMGFWQAIIQAAAGVAKGVGEAVSSAVRRRRQDKETTAAARRATLEQQALIRSANQKKMLLIGGAAVAALAILYFATR